MKKHLQPLTPAALYARVSSDRQDVDLSVAAQLRALRDYARANGYSVAREYVDEAETGRVADRPQFREMIEEGAQPNSPFREILIRTGVAPHPRVPSSARPAGAELELPRPGAKMSPGSTEPL